MKRPYFKYIVGLLLFGSNGVIASYIHLSSYEIVLLRSVLGAALLLEPSSTDTYFEQYDMPTIFVVKGKKVIVGSKRLADALCRLSEQRRTVLLMYFFLGYTDTQIGYEYGHCRSTANYWKLAALKQLRKEWGNTEHEE